MNVKKIYKTNMLFASIYFIIILLTTILAFIFNHITFSNLARDIKFNGLPIDIILCFIFSFIMLFDSHVNYKNGKSFYDKNINSLLMKIAIILFYIFVIMAIIMYIYKIVTLEGNIQPDGMALGSIIILNAINNSIIKIKFD